MATFTPPSILVVPPISVADTKTGLPTKRANPGGWNLMKYFPQRSRGVNVWIMNDGTVLMSDPVPGLSFYGTISYPYPDTLEPVNDTLSSSWFPGGPGGVGSSGPGGLQQYVTPGISYEYLGGHSYPLSSYEQATLTSAGLGAYIQ